MRPPQLIVLLVCFVAIPILLTFLSLLSAHPRRSDSEFAGSGESGFRALFSFHTPSSLFPSSAIISLTDDNSTFFLARPAAFGPLLPTKGLSGQLWVGSGFGDDSLRRSGLAAGAEGELGCSDVPGWGEGDDNAGDDVGMSPDEKTSSSNKDGPVKGPTRQGSAGTKKKLAGSSPRRGGRDEVATQHDGHPSPHDDGTDDYLHRPLGDSTLSTPSQPGQYSSGAASAGRPKAPEHADIQSLQESAEITGKIVLLSRGGCGFLEKAKWAQRRGAIALIVGDNTRGGGLVTMYARGDTSNVTTPSLFTSYTTAHLLSSLIPPDGKVDNSHHDPAKLPPVGKGRIPLRKKYGKGSKIAGSLPTFTPTMPRPKATSTAKASTRGASSSVSKSLTPTESNRSWLRSFLSRLGFTSRDSHPSKVENDSRRPPSSGQIDWVLTEDTAKNRENSKSGKTEGHAKPVKPPASGVDPLSIDDFEIGVHDWRDPDLVRLPSAYAKTDAPQRPKGDQQKSPSTDAPRAKSNAKGNGELQGGSITPGSGEYHSLGKTGTANADASQAKSPQSDTHGDSNSGSGNSPSSGWLSHIPWVGDGEESHAISDDQTSSGRQSNAWNELLSSGEDEDGSGDPEEHEGLWVTLTPTNISTSPFFDTLLVLVVSPLVTLTVVYALLLLRSRIRRRRWRAPKSLVERLPVRTYRTLPSNPSSPRVASPPSLSPTSPLLQSSVRPVSPGPRQRSYTASDILESPEVSRSRLMPIDENESSKHGVFERLGSPRPAQRRRYAGHQEECVVCLEEYVDGVSRVMRLPCGHEFHVECITPWLTTRRRTCPICKGDVVRSITHGAPSPRSRFFAHQDNLEDDDGDDSSSPSLRSQSREDEDAADLENGENAAASPLLIGEGAPASVTIWSRCRDLAQSGVGSLRTLSARLGLWTIRPTVAERDR